MALIKSARAVVDNQPPLQSLKPGGEYDPKDRIVQPHCWVGGIPFSYWEQYLTIEDVLWSTILYALISAVVVSLLFISVEQWAAGSPVIDIIKSAGFGSFMITVIIALSVISVIGMLAWSETDLSALSAMTCLTTVGFATEFAVHITHTFNAYSGTGVQRGKSTMTELFVPTFMAFFSSVIGILFLATSDFGFCVYYIFRPLIICVCVTYFFGIFFLPVILQLACDLGLAPTFGEHSQSVDGQRIERHLSNSKQTVPLEKVKTDAASGTAAFTAATPGTAALES